MLFSTATYFLGMLWTKVVKTFLLVTTLVVMARSLRSKKGTEKTETEILQSLLAADPEGVRAEFIDSEIGMGVFAQRDFKQGQPILFYVGELLSANEGRKREQKYTEKDGSYLYFFNHNGDSWCIDATKPDGRLGRLVNDSATPNCVVKKVVVHSLPYLCLVALKDITFGTEICYDYGVKDLPWRMKLPKL